MRFPETWSRQDWSFRVWREMLQFQILGVYTEEATMLYYNTFSHDTFMRIVNTHQCRLTIQISSIIVLLKQLLRYKTTSLSPHVANLVDLMHSDDFYDLWVDYYINGEKIYPFVFSLLELRFCSRRFAHKATVDLIRSLGKFVDYDDHTRFILAIPQKLRYDVFLDTHELIVSRLRATFVFMELKTPSWHERVRCRLLAESIILMGCTPDMHQFAHNLVFSFPQQLVTLECGLWRVYVTGRFQGSSHMHGPELGPILSNIARKFQVVRKKRAKELGANPSTTHFSENPFICAACARRGVAKTDAK